MRRVRDPVYSSCVVRLFTLVLSLTTCNREGLIFILSHVCRASPCILCVHALTLGLQGAWGSFLFLPSFFSSPPPSAAAEEGGVAAEGEGAVALEGKEEEEGAETKRGTKGSLVE